MKGFYISIKNDLLEPKHYQNMGEAIWLYLWLIDKMTSITESGVGKVSGGQPITTEGVQIELGLPVRTYRRYVTRLKEHGYISTIRTPHGLIFSVNKASKPFKRSAKNGTSKSNSDVPNMSSDVPNSVQSSAKLAHVYIDNNKTIQDNNNITNVIGSNEPVVYGKPEINSLFNYWQEQVGYEIQAKLGANRKACNNLLKKHGDEKLRQLVVGVGLTQADQFAPRISDFCELQTKLNSLVMWGRKRQQEVQSQENVRI